MMNRNGVPTGGRIRQGLLIGLAIASVVTMVQCSSGDGDGGGTTTAPPTGRSYSQFAYTANFESGNVSMFGVDSTGALVSLGAPLPAGRLPHTINVDPRGRFAYASNHEENFLSGYRINSRTGILTPIPGPLTIGDSVHASVFDRTGRFLYVINGLPGGATPDSVITAYTVNANGTLTAIGAPLSAGTHAHNLTVDPGNTFVYVASDTSNNIFVYAIDPATGALTAVGAPVAGFDRPAAVAVHPLGRFAYVVNEGDIVQIFDIDQATGALTPNALGATIGTNGTRPHSIAIDTTGSFLYVGNIDSNNISGYQIVQATGELVPLPGSPFPTGLQPNDLTMHPGGGFVYVANYASDNISRLAIDSATGDLTPSGTFPDPTVVDLDGPSGLGITNF
jgi:6-phosphogluconolactonase (cycloisomerase 2 family)